MFSQKLGSSPDNAWRKLGSMGASFLLHALVAGALFITPLLIAGASEFTDSQQNAVLVATFNYTPQPGDPNRKDLENTLHIAKPESITERTDIAGRLKLPEWDTKEPNHDLLVLADTESSIPKITFGFHGSRQCVCGHVLGVGRQPWTQETGLLKKVEPQYPLGARQAGIQGTVVVRVVIESDGAVTEILVISGPQQLRVAAVDAIRQWRYRPYVLDGVAVPVETMITVNFVLPAGQDAPRIM